MTSLVPIRVEVPISAFRPYSSREYQDTFSIPTPSSVYGMLLSLLGVRREDKELHRGAELAIAVEKLPPRSKVFRKLRRGADLEDTRPDYQDLLMGLRMWVWLRSGSDRGSPPLCERVPAALANPASIDRFGGLSLGESSYLVDVVSIDETPPPAMFFLQRDKRGFYSLPIWVDHRDARLTISDRFSVSSALGIDEGLTNAWLRIGELL